MFECPRCEKETSLVMHADRNHFGICNTCRVWFWAARNLFTVDLTPEEQEEIYNYWVVEQRYEYHDVFAPLPLPTVTQTNKESIT